MAEGVQGYQDSALVLNTTQKEEENEIWKEGF
jgi:hypothetical protein